MVEKKKMKIYRKEMSRIEKRYNGSASVNWNALSYSNMEQKSRFHKVKTRDEAIHYGWRRNGISRVCKFCNGVEMTMMRSNVF